MCFSANISLSMSAILALIGTLTITKVKEKAQIPFALIPYFFSIQQLTEGFLWLTLQGKLVFSFNMASVLIYIYLFFALLFWPIWIPISVFFLEKKNLRKKLLFISLLTGIIVSIFFIFSIVNYGITARIESNHILYEFKFLNIFYLLYLIATALPFFLSSIEVLWLFGILLLFSLYMSYYFYINFITSVWCFFAALLSIFVYVIILRVKK